MMEQDKKKPDERPSVGYPMPPPPWFDGREYLESVQQVVEIDENTGLQKVMIYKQ